MVHWKISFNNIVDNISMEKSIYCMHECKKIRSLLAKVSQSTGPLLISRNHWEPNGTLVVNSILFKNVKYRRHHILFPFQIWTIWPIFTKHLVCVCLMAMHMHSKILIGHTVKAGLFWTKGLWCIAVFWILEHYT